jgi:hypothetical protein
VKEFSRQEIFQWSEKHLATDSIIVTDGLSCFTGIKKAGYVHPSISTGGGPDSVESKEFKRVNTMLGNVKNAIRATYHTISAKQYTSLSC